VEDHDRARAQTAHDALHDARGAGPVRILGVDVADHGLEPETTHVRGLSRQHDAEGRTVVARRLAARRDHRRDRAPDLDADPPARHERWRQQVEIAVCRDLVALAPHASQQRGGSGARCAPA
jgi:hypothetical protein